MIFNLLAEETTNAQQSGWQTYLVFGLLIVGIIALFVWQSISGKKKQKEAQNMVNALKVGDRVKTIGGICGFVAEINNNENTFVLETGLDGNKSYVKFDKGAIYQTAPAQGSAVAEKETKTDEVVLDETKTTVEENNEEKSE